MLARPPPLFPSRGLLGALPRMREDPLALFLQAHALLGDVVRFKLFGLTAVQIADPALVERVLVTKQRAYAKQTRGYAVLRKMLGNGLVTSEGDFWLRQRRIAQPAFHRDVVASFADIMTRAGADMVARWRPRIDDGAPFDVAHEMMEVTLRIVGETLLSTDVTGQSDDVGAAVTTLLVQAMYRTTHPLLLPDAFPTRLNREFKAARAVLDRVVLGMIEARRLAGPPYRAADGRLDLLALLMGTVDEETGESMTNAQLRDEVMTVFLAGHETTANALAWTLHHLDLRRDVQAAVRAELARELQGRAPTLQDLPRLSLLGRVLKESMRLHPPVWMLARAALEDDVLGGFTVKRGTIVFTSQYLVHRHPRLWPDPERFDPDRFLVEDPARPKYAYFPFSGGPRKCIGDQFANMEALLLLAIVLQACTLTTVPGHPVVPHPSITLRPLHGLKMTASPATAIPSTIVHGANDGAASPRSFRSTSPDGPA